MPREDEAPLPSWVPEWPRGGDDADLAALIRASWTNAPSTPSDGVGSSPYDLPWSVLGDDDDADADADPPSSSSSTAASGPTARALRVARLLCRRAEAAASRGDVLTATRLLFHAALGDGGAIAEIAPRHLRTSAAQRVLATCARCVDAEQCPRGCPGAPEHPNCDAVRAAGFMLLCLRAAFASDDAARASASRAVANAVASWDAHFAPRCAIDARLVESMCGGEDALVGRAVAAILCVSARASLREGAIRTPATPADADADASRASDAIRLASLALRADPTSAHARYARGRARTRANDFRRAAADFAAAATAFSATCPDAPWTSDAWRCVVEASATALALGQGFPPGDASAPTAGSLREAARRSEEARRRAEALFGRDGEAGAHSAPCAWDFGPMLDAIEGLGDDDAITGDIARAFQKAEREKLAAAAAGAARVDEGGEGTAAAEEEEEEEDEDGATTTTTTTTTTTKLGVPAPPSMPTASKLTFNASCARAGCENADPRVASKNACELVSCEHCAECFWCSTRCASEDFRRHRSEECRAKKADGAGGGSSRR